jgi:hypothetical protein
MAKLAAALYLQSLDKEKDRKKGKIHGSGVFAAAKPRKAEGAFKPGPSKPSPTAAPVSQDAMERITSLPTLERRSGFLSAVPRLSPPQVLLSLLDVFLFLLLLLLETGGKSKYLECVLSPLKSYAKWLCTTATHTHTHTHTHAHTHAHTHTHTHPLLILPTTCAQDCVLFVSC